MNMPAPVLIRFNEWVAKNDFPNKDVKSWVNDFTRSAADKWTDADLPDVSALSDTEVERLYVKLRETFRSMAANKDDYRNEDAAKFVDKYFGTGNLFEDSPLKPGEETQIKNVINQIKNYVRPEYREKIDDVLSGNKSINEPEIKSAVRDAIYEFYNSRHSDKVPEDELNNAYAILESSENEVPQNKVDDLRAKIPDIFETLYKKGGIRDIFKNNDQDKTVSNQIDMALSKTDYAGKTNDKNYVAPKYKDGTKNPVQWVDSKLKDTYNNVLKRYVTAHRDKVFMKPEAKAIFGALDKEGVKPTDGLNTVIEKSEGIAGKLRGKEPFKAAEHFTWLTDKLKKFKDNGLGDDIDGALRWGYQMRRIVQHIIEEAAESNEETEKAKTALEEIGRAHV